jgi:hypothetical protein
MFMWFIVAVLVCIIALLLVQRYTKLEFVSHAKLLWKTWSIWLGTLGTTLTAWMVLVNDAAVTAWSYLPDDVKAALPPRVVEMVGPFLMFMALMSQFVKQRKLAAEAKQNG